ncbi:hypothetical protein [Erwinia persicina]|nr:hypothetical protein [Erwinia persicina]
MNMKKATRLTSRLGDFLTDYDVGFVALTLAVIAAIHLLCYFLMAYCDA